MKPIVLQSLQPIYHIIRILFRVTNVHSFIDAYWEYKQTGLTKASQFLVYVNMITIT